MSVQTARRGAVASSARRRSAAPAAAAAAGFTTRTFNDDFTSISTIDFAGTASAGAGYNWTNKNPFVNETSVCTSSNTTITGSVLTVSQSADNGNIGLCTTNRATSSHLAGPWLHGYFEALIKFDAAAVAGSGFGWPSFWSIGATHALLTNGTRWPEIDFFEFAKDVAKASGGVYAASIHDHDKSSGTEVDRWNGGQNTVDVNPATWNAFHTYGCLWQANSVKWYFDNTLISTQTWTSTTQSPTGTNANSGTYVITDNATDGPACIFLGTGSAAAMLVDWVRVWQ